MAREKKSMIGFDPLAWLDNDEKQLADITDQSVENKANIENNNPVSKKSNIKKRNGKKIITISGYAIDEIALLKGYSLVSDVMEVVVTDFYNELFMQHPELKTLFENFNEQSQAGNLTEVLKLLIDNLHNEEMLNAALSSLAQRHQKYEALKDHCPVVIEALIRSLKNKIGRSWTKAISAAWRQLLLVASEMMCAAYNEILTEEIEDEIINTETEEAKDDESADENESSFPVIKLQTVQDICKSQSLKNDMLSMVNDHDEIDIDASSVERIDGSALQLLCALFEYAHKNNIVIHWIKPSETIIESAKILGVHKILGLS
ncbi:hypothetical protein MNBD_GAMMA09-675 [hydrothermal vent metagenome]|uniref:Globin family profile domain-containing protein n=1 Tax=hydrothermal vent metagenome TaxID=652676 RepID=A0A3B0XR76_9ZZZZ